MHLVSGRDVGDVDRWRRIELVPGAVGRGTVLRLLVVPVWMMELGEPGPRRSRSRWPKSPGTTSVCTAGTTQSPVTPVKPPNPVRRELTRPVAGLAAYDWPATCGWGPLRKWPGLVWNMRRDG